MPKLTLEEMVHDKYHDDAVAEHILKDVEAHATGDKILSGELVLPSVEDATRNHQIATGTFAATPNEAILRDENRKLMERLDSLEARIDEPATKKGR